MGENFSKAPKASLWAEKLDGDISLAKKKRE